MNIQELMEKNKEFIKQVCNAIDEYSLPRLECHSCAADLYVCPFCESDVKEYECRELAQSEIMEKIDHYDDCLFIIKKEFIEGKNNDK